MHAWQATQRDPGDFDAVYNHGLALQELASRITASGADQMRLLTQARCLPAPVPGPYVVGMPQQSMTQRDNRRPRVCHAFFPLDPR